MPVLSYVYERFNVDQCHAYLSLKVTKSVRCFSCKTRDFCTDACGSCVGQRASGKAVGRLRPTMRGSQRRWRLATRPTPQRGRRGLGRWHSQGKRRKGQAVLAAGLRSQGPLERERPDPLGSTANDVGTLPSSMSSARVIPSLDSIPSSSPMRGGRVPHTKG